MTEDLTLPPEASTLKKWWEMGHWEVCRLGKKISGDFAYNLKHEYQVTLPAK